MEDQKELALLGRLDGPSVAPAWLVARCRTYREAVRMCYGLRRVRRMSHGLLAEMAGLYPQHVSDYLAADDKPKRRDLPGGRVQAFEAVCGNTLITQWHATRAGLTVLEEVQADRHAPTPERQAA